MNHASEDNARFRVIIVGGSIAGLTLAHCLSQADIDHVVLEKRAEIAPQEGAFIGIWPNGARVFEQLDLYADFEETTAPIHRMHVRYPDGFWFSSSLPKVVHERLGYPIISLERRKVLQVLHERYQRKSNILVNKKVIEVQSLQHGISVTTEDGSEYTGDLVVGADGIHSVIRSEMWRLADAKSPAIISAQDKKAFTVEYACIFGISTALPKLRTGEHINSYSNGLCVITFHGKGGRIFWFILVKLQQKYVYPHAPRFSPDDTATFCEKYSTIRIWEDICVADLWKNKEVASMTALEEGLLQTWHFDRIVLLGDSIHKMTPNIGQGANTAVEDAAVLASLLKKLATTHQNASTPRSAINILLNEYVSMRFKRASSTFERSRFGARFHTRDDVLKAFVGRYIFPHLGRQVVDRTCKSLVDAPLIDFLPAPERPGAAWGTTAAQPKWALICVPLLVSFSLYFWFKGVFLPSTWIAL